MARICYSGVLRFVALAIVVFLVEQLVSMSRTAILLRSSRPIKSPRRREQPLAWLRSAHLEVEDQLQNYRKTAALLGFRLCSASRCSGSMDDELLSKRWNLYWGLHIRPGAMRRRFVNKSEATVPLAQTLVGETFAGRVLGKRSLLELLSYCSNGAVMPHTYRLPRDLARFDAQVDAQPQWRWLAKPLNRHSATMIEVVNASEARRIGEQGRASVRAGRAPVLYSIQRMVEPPLLIDGRVADVGLFVLLSGDEPMRAYALADWKVRVASFDFEQAERNSRAFATNSGRLLSSSSFRPLRRLWLDSNAGQLEALLALGLDERRFRAELIQRVHSIAASALKVAAPAIEVRLKAVRKYALGKDFVSAMVFINDNSPLAFFQQCRFDVALRRREDGGVEAFILEVNFRPGNQHSADRGRRPRQYMAEMLIAVGALHNDCPKNVQFPTIKQWHKEQTRALTLTRLVPQQGGPWAQPDAECGEGAKPTDFPWGASSAEEINVWTRRGELVRRRASAWYELQCWRDIAFCR